MGERAVKPRGAPRSRFLARLTSLAQIGELARRLYISRILKLLEHFYFYILHFVYVRRMW